MPTHERMFNHEHAAKLDDPARLVWQPPADVIRAVGLKPGMTVADIGAGTGYFTIPIAQALAPQGVVQAIDVQSQMLDRLRPKVTSDLHVELTSAEASRTPLARGSVDVVFCANLWHELDNQAATLDEFARIVRPGGRVAIVDWRADVSLPPGPPIEHRVPVAKLLAQLRQRGWGAVRDELIGDYCYLVVATWPEADAR